MTIYIIFGLTLALVNYVESRFEPWNKTAGSLYNPATEMCCGGFPFPRQKDSQCCGSNVYDKSTQFCCDESKVLEQGKGASCSGSYSQYTDSLYCGGKTVDVAYNDRGYVFCCGTDMYDTRKQTCCSARDKYTVYEGQHLSCCGDKVYDRKTELCCSEYDNSMRTITYRVAPSDGNKTACCGDVIGLYGRYSETCCGGKVKSGSQGCYDGKLFDVSTQIICGGQVIEKNGKSMQCCKDQAYDTQSELCCVGDYTDEGSNFKVVNKTDPKQTTCCGLEPYNYNTHICCYPDKKLAEKLNPNDYQCCAGKSYSYGKGLCCNDRLFPDADTKSHECCGGDLMDKEKYICCGNEIVENSKSCCGDAEVYDSRTKLCCSTGNNYGSNSKNYTITEKTSDKIACCKSKSFDLEKELCCGDEVIPKSEDNLCCGTKSYNTKKEICCGDLVFSKENGRESCCLYGSSD